MLLLTESPSRDSGVRGSVLSVLTKFLSNRSEYVMVDGSRCKLVNVGPLVPRRNVLGPLLLLLYTEELFSIVQKQARRLC